MSMSMNSATVSIVSLWPDPDRRLDLDLKHIVSALRPFWAEWRWCVKNLDWLGDQSSEDICKAVERAGQIGLWMSSEELVDNANKVYQTIEGQFLAFPTGTDPRTLSSVDLNLREFPSNRAQLVIAAIDGWFFNVYAKDATFLMPFRNMKGVRQEDPNVHF
jgi:hypothetical protein